MSSRLCPGDLLLILSLMVIIMKRKSNSQHGKVAGLAHKLQRVFPLVDHAA